MKERRDLVSYVGTCCTSLALLRSEQRIRGGGYNGDRADNLPMISSMSGLIGGALLARASAARGALGVLDAQPVLSPSSG